MKKKEQMAAKKRKREKLQAKYVYAIVVVHSEWLPPSLIHSIVFLCKQLGCLVALSIFYLLIVFTVCTACRWARTREWTKQQGNTDRLQRRTEMLQRVQANSDKIQVEMKEVNM